MKQVIAAEVLTAILLQQKGLNIAKKAKASLKKFNDARQPCMDFC